MANRNTVGFGLIPTGTVGSTPATAGQGKYFIDAAYNVSLFQGSVVQSKVGYIKDAESTRTLNTIGILNGIFYNAATTLKPCLLYTSPSPRDGLLSRMPSSA